MSKTYSRNEHRRTDFVDKSLEFELVGGVLSSKSIMEVIYKTFDSNWLTIDKLKYIYDMSISFYENQGVLIDYRSFKTMLNIENKKKELYISIWKKAKRVGKGSSLASAIAASEKIKRFYHARCIQIGTMRTVERLIKAQSGETEFIENASESIKELNEMLVDAEYNIQHYDPVENFIDFKKFHVAAQKNPELIRGIETGINKIDAPMGGLRSGEFGLILAATGVGKSILLQNFAVHCWRHYGDVVLVTIEMPGDQVSNRIYCQLSGIHFDKFRNYRLTGSDFEKINREVNKIKKLDHKLHILDMPEGCSAKTIKHEVRSIINKRKDKVRLIVIDYMNIMSTDDGQRSTDWPVQLQIATDLKLDVARGLNIPTWSAAQTDDKGGAAFSKHIKDQLDVGLKMYEDETTENTGVLNFKWWKTRDFKGSGFSLQTDRGRMIFGKHERQIDEELEEVTGYKRIKT